MAGEAVRGRAAAAQTFAANAAILLLGLGSSVVLSRVLGARGRGELAAALLWPVLLAFVGSIGIPRATLYFAALPDARPAAVLGNALLLAAAQSAVLVALGFVALPWLLSSQSADVVALARLYLAVIPLALGSQNALCILQARIHLRAYNALRTIVPIGYLAGCAALAASARLDVHGAVVLQLGLTAVLAGASAVWVRRTGIVRRLELDRGLLKEMLSYGVRVQAGDVSHGLNLRLDQTLMAALLPPSALGIYVAAVSAASPAQVLATAVGMVATPLIARSAPSARGPLLEAVFRRYALASLAGGAALALAIPPLVPVLFGREFTAAVPVAEVLLIGVLALGAKEVLAAGAQAMGHPWLASRAELVALGVTVVGLAALLPSLGVMGAALASVLAYATALGVIVRGASRELGLRAAELLRPKVADLRALVPESPLKSLAPRLGRAGAAAGDPTVRPGEGGYE